MTAGSAAGGAERPAPPEPATASVTARPRWCKRRIPVMSLRYVLAAAWIVVAALAFPACSNQAEGERCDVNNNNDDCQEGLICKPSTELGGSADICCPEGTSELPECTIGGGASSTTTGTGATTTATTATTTVTSSSTSTGDGGAGGGGGGGGAPGDGGAGGN